MRVAIVNDLRMAVEVLRRIVQSIPDAQVAWVAENGQEAIDRCLQDRPDLILMDMIMPVMNGVQATRRIMTDCPCPILVTTANVRTNVSYVYEALGCGAVDAVNTPAVGPGGSLEGAQELIRKMHQLVRLQQTPRPCPSAVPHLAATTRSTSVAAPLVAIGSSTGGPQVLKTLLAQLPAKRPYAVIIVQHLDPIFVPGLVDWLARDTEQPVRTIREGQQPVAGAILIACTSDHLVLDNNACFRYVREPAACVHRPSVDTFFSSLLTAPIEPGVAVLLTGMGQDGAQGLQQLQRRGWQTIAQDQASSVIWGMPGAAVRLGAAGQILPADRIGAAIDRALRRHDSR
jgi:two-component system response regulator WspF